MSLLTRPRRLGSLSALYAAHASSHTHACLSYLPFRNLRAMSARRYAYMQIQPAISRSALFPSSCALARGGERFSIAYLACRDVARCAIRCPGKYIPLRSIATRTRMTRAEPRNPAGKISQARPISTLTIRSSGGVQSLVAIR